MSPKVVKAVDDLVVPEDFQRAGSRVSFMYSLGIHMKLTDVRDSAHMYQVLLEFL